MERKTPFKVKLGEKIKFLRKKNNMTQGELGEKLGTIQPTVANWESGYSQPSNQIISKLALLFNVSVDYILGNTTILNPKTYLEETLSTYNLSENEYDDILYEILETNTFNLSTLNFNGKKNEKVRMAYLKIFSVYINYMKSNQLDNDVDIEENMKKVKKIDEVFKRLLKSLDKNKIIHNIDDVVFPTIDVPNKLPVLGKISAGLPILATENIEGYEFAPSSYLKEDFEYFYLRVQGDSMSMEFPEGALLLVQRQDTIENGQIGVFRIDDDEATVKKYKEDKVNNLIFLEPRSYNPKHDTQSYEPSRVKVIGKVITATRDIN